MTLAAGFGTGQVVWSLVWLGLFVLVVGLFTILFTDIARSDDLSGGRKALWLFILLVLPLVGGLVYLAVRGDSMNRRLVEEGLHAPTEPVGGSAEHERFRLAALRDAGQITDAEFRQATERLSTSPDPGPSPEGES